MRTEQERFANLQSALSFIGEEIHVITPYPTLCAPYGDDLHKYGFNRIEWAPFIWQSQGEIIPKDNELFEQNKLFSIGLASVLTCLQFDLKPGDSVLDTCAAPGIKSLYLQILHKGKLDLYVNDISIDRLHRLKRLFDKFDVPQPTFTRQPAQTLHNRYHKKFDAVLIDAVCSGEGEIFAGDTAVLRTWSQAKVNRLSSEQRKIIKSAVSLVKPKGQCVYATCTLNQKENEQALKKAGIAVRTLPVKELTTMHILQQGDARRILPSNTSIGFFLAKIL